MEKLQDLLQVLVNQYAGKDDVESVQTSFSVKMQF
jgi:hypothetical protein